jgi:hypothetical protein
MPKLSISIDIPRYMPQTFVPQAYAAPQHFLSQSPRHVKRNDRWLPLSV